MHIKCRQNSPLERVAGWPAEAKLGVLGDEVRSGTASLWRAESQTPGGTPSLRRYNYRSPGGTPIARTKQLSTPQRDPIIRPITLSTLARESITRPKTLSTLARESIISHKNYQFRTRFQAGSGTTDFHNNYQLSTLIIDFRL